MSVLSHLRRARQARPRRPRQGEEGFTIIELMIAMTLIAVLMLSLAYVGTGSLADISYSSQRQQATGLANQALEEVRALPFATVANGLSSTDLAGDSNITYTCSGTNPCFQGEQIPVFTGSGSGAGTSSNPAEPLAPSHQQSTVIGAATFTTSAYVTYYNNQASSGSYRVTVIVKWNHAARKVSVSQVQTQTIISSPSGCISNTTHPFAAPCGAFFYSTASDQSGVIEAEGDPPGSDNPPISNFDLSTASFALQTLTADLQLEQVQEAKSAATTSGATVQYSDSTPTGSTGAQQGTATASTDPSENLPGYSSSGAISQSATTLTATQNSNTATVTPGTSDTAQAAAASSASGASPCASEGSMSSSGTISPGTNLATSAPCANSQGQQLGSTATMTLNAAAGSSTLGAATLASVAASPSATTVAGAFYPSAGTSACTGLTSGGAGCIHAGAVRSLGTVQLGGLPTGSWVSTAFSKYASWAGYMVKLTGYSDSVSSEAGVGAAAPTTSISSGAQISYWNGSGYSTMSVPTGTSSVSIPAATVDFTDTTHFGQPLEITVTPSLTTGATMSTTDPAAGCTAPCTRTSSGAQITSPISGNLVYTVKYGGTTVANVELVVNLGTLKVSTNYTAAASS